MRGVMGEAAGCPELAVADATWRVVDKQRLTRTQFERWFANRAVSLVVMEACGSVTGN